MSLLSDPEFLIYSLRLQYIRRFASVDTLAPLIVTFPPTTSSPYVQLSGLNNPERWPALREVRSPEPSSQELFGDGRGRRKRWQRHDPSNGHDQQTGGIAQPIQRPLPSGLRADNRHSKDGAVEASEDERAAPRTSLKYSETIVGDSGGHGIGLGMRVGGKRRSWRGRGIDGSGGTVDSAAANRPGELEGKRMGRITIDESEEDEQSENTGGGGLDEQASDEEEALWMQRSAHRQQQTESDAEGTVPNSRRSSKQSGGFFGQRRMPSDSSAASFVPSTQETDSTLEAGRRHPSRPPPLVTIQSPAHTPRDSPVIPGPPAVDSPRTPATDQASSPVPRSDVPRESIDMRPQLTSATPISATPSVSSTFEGSSAEEDRLNGLARTSLAFEQSRDKVVSDALLSENPRLAGTAPGAIAESHGTSSSGLEAAFSMPNTDGAPASIEEEGDVSEEEDGRETDDDEVGDLPSGMSRQAAGRRVRLETPQEYSASSVELFNPFSVSVSSFPSPMPPSSSGHSPLTQPASEPAIAQTEGQTSDRPPAETAPGQPTEGSGQQTLQPAPPMFRRRERRRVNISARIPMPLPVMMEESEADSTKAANAKEAARAASPRPLPEPSATSQVFVRAPSPPHPGPSGRSRAATTTGVRRESGDSIGSGSRSQSFSTPQEYEGSRPMMRDDTIKPSTTGPSQPATTKLRQHPFKTDPETYIGSGAIADSPKKADPLSAAGPGPAALRRKVSAPLLTPNAGPSTDKLDHQANTRPSAPQSSPSNRSASRHQAPALTFPLRRKPVGQPPQRAVSALTALLNQANSSSAVPNPFTGLYGSVASKETGALKLTVYFPHSKEPRKPVKLTVRDVTVEEVIGYALWTYWEGTKEPKLEIDDDAEEGMETAKWNLRIVEDDGEVDEDFPALDRQRAISKFTFDEFAVVKATPSQRKANEAVQAQISRPAAKLLPMSRQTTAGVGQAQSIAPDAGTLVPPVAGPAVSAAGTPLKSSTLGLSSPLAAPVFLRIRIPIGGEVEDIVTTINVGSDTYLADVLDMVCKKRKLVTKEWALKVADRDIVVPLDRTVESLQDAKNLTLVKRATVQNLIKEQTRVGKLQNTNPSASIFKRLSEPPQPQYFSDLDLTSTYKKFTVQRKLPMPLGRHERVLSIDGEYIYILPSESRVGFGGGRTSSYHISNVAEVKQSTRAANSFKLVVWKDKDVKRYDFEAESKRQAEEIIHDIRALMSKWRAQQGDASRR